MNLYTVKLKLNKFEHVGEGWGLAHGGMGTCVGLGLWVGEGWGGLGLGPIQNPPTPVDTQMQLKTLYSHNFVSMRQPSWINKNPNTPHFPTHALPVDRTAPYVQNITCSRPMLESRECVLVPEESVGPPEGARAVRTPALDAVVPLRVALHPPRVVLQGVPEPLRVRAEHP